MFWETGTFWLSIVLALSVPIVLIGIFHNRLKSEGKGGGARGVGWKVLRFTVISISLPLVALLALNGALSSEVATLMGTALGFAFGKGAKGDDG